MYTLYGYPKTRSVRVAWALEELGLPREYSLVDLKQGQHLQKDLKPSVLPLKSQRFRRQKVPNGIGGYRHFFS